MSKDGTVVTIDGRPALRFERRLAHPVDVVWRAVTDPGELQHWFPARVTVDLREGGEMSFAFPDDVGPPETGEVLALVPPRRFAFTWGGQEMSFELEPLDGGAGCVLTFTHVIADLDGAARDMAGWHVCFDLLERHLRGEDATGPTSEPTPEWRELYDRYTAAGVPSGAAIPGEG